MQSDVVGRLSGVVRLVGRTTTKYAPFNGRIKSYTRFFEIFVGFPRLIVAIPLANPQFSHLDGSKPYKDVLQR